MKAKFELIMTFTQRILSLQWERYINWLKFTCEYELEIVISYLLNYDNFFNTKICILNQYSFPIKDFAIKGMKGKDNNTYSNRLKSLEEMQLKELQKYLELIYAK